MKAKAFKEMLLITMASKQHTFSTPHIWLLVPSSADITFLSAFSLSEIKLPVFNINPCQTCVRQQHRCISMIDSLFNCVTKIYSFTV